MGCLVRSAHCPDCGAVVLLSEKDVQASLPRCSRCIAATRREVELHAAVYAPLLIASFAMTGRWPEIDV